MEILKKENSLNRVEIAQAEAGHPPSAQRRRCVDCSERILTIVDDYQNRDDLQYLRGQIANNIGI